MTPKEWFERFRMTEGFRAVRKAAQEAFPASDSDVLLNWICNACAHAATYQRKLDPNHVRRRADTAELAAARGHLALIKRLSDRLKKTPNMTPLAVMYARNSAAQKGVALKVIDGQERPMEDLLLITLKALQEGFETASQKVKAKNNWSAATIGCLQYSVPLRRRSKLPSADTMLLFALVLFFRCRSNGKVCLSQGEPMPKNGEPRFDLAVRIVTAVFPDSRIDTYQAAQTRLHELLKNNEILLVNWPHEQTISQEENINSI